MTLWLALCAPAHAYIIINAPMTDTNSSNWVLGGNPTSAQLTGDGNPDPVGSGWLRLTNNQTNQTGFAYNNTTFDLSAGLLIQFDYTSWGGSGADGTSIFLFDGGVSPFNIGAFGGSLGYARKVASGGGTLACGSYAEATVKGISGGYVGIGLDEYGNFAACTEGRYQGWNKNSTTLDANTVTVRGSVTGFGNGAVGQTLGLQSYPWITTSGAGSDSLWINSSTRPNQTSDDYRRVIIQISPPDANDIPYANVYVQFGYSNAPTQMLSNVPLPQISSSQQLRVGFGASTGGATNYHEVRNLLITNAGASTSIDLGITKTAVAQGTSTTLNSLPVGAPFQYVLTATHNGPNDIFASGVGVTDSFPANVTGGSWSCNVVSAGTSDKGTTACPSPPNGTLTGNTLSTTANLSQGGSVAFTVNATIPTAPAAHSVSNTATLGIPGAISDYYGGDDNSTLTLPVYYPPLGITKSISPSTVTSTATRATMTLTVTNPTSVTASGIAFADTYPTGLKNGSTSGTYTSGTCKTTYGATVTATTGGLSVSNLNLPAGRSCTITESYLVGSATGATYVNTIPAGALTTTTANVPTNAVAATDDFTIMASATLPKPTQAFSPAQIGINGSSTLTMSFTNPNGADITGVGFTDTITTGAVISGTPVSTCNGGTITAANNVMTVSGLSIPPGGCTIQSNVTSATAGTYTSPNSFTVSSTNDGSTTMAAATSLTVLKLPTISKSFASATALPGANDTLTVTLTNPNTTVDITGAQFTDTFPNGLFTSGTAATTCGGTGVTATASNSPTGGILTLGGPNGATIPHGGSCTVTVNATSPTAAPYTNSIPVGGLTTANAGSNAAAASAAVTVMSPPGITKSFTPNSVAIGAKTTLAIILSNTNSVAMNGVAFTDTYPKNMTNLTTAPTTQCGGTVTPVNGTNPSLSYSGTLAAGTTCTITQDVTISAADSYTNTIPVGGMTTTNAGSNTVAATANLNGPQPPTVTMTFAPTPVLAGSTSTMTINIANPNLFNLTNAGFTDTYPTGLVNMATPAVTNSCGGTLTATPGTGALSLTGGTIPTAGCVITVPVSSASTGGTLTNTMSIVATKEAPNSNAAAGSLFVTLPPAATVSFTPSTVVVNDTSTLAVILSNPTTNTADITGVSFTDNYPNNGAGVKLVNTTATTTFDSSSSTGCKGTISGAVGSSSLSLSDATIPVGGTCIIKIGVSGAAVGTYNNSTGAISSAESGTGAAATAALTTILQGAPTVTKSFGPASVPVGQPSVMTITLSNPTSNALPVTGVNFADTYPSNGASGQLVNASSTTTFDASSSSDCKGTINAASGGSTLSLANASIPVKGTCIIKVNVSSSSAGTYNNSIASITSSNSASTSASGSLGVLAAPTVSDRFVPPTVPITTASTLTIAIANPNTTDMTGVSFTSNYSRVSGVGSLVNSGGAVQFINQTTKSNCSGNIVATPAASSVSLSDGVIPAGTTCTLTLSVNSTGNTNNAVGTYQNSVVVASDNAPTSATQTAQLGTIVLASPVISKSFNPTSVPADGQPHTSTLTITLSNPAGNAWPITGVTGAGTNGLLDTFPSGMTTASGATLTNTCGGTGTLASGSLSISGGTIPAGVSGNDGSCTLSTTVQVTASSSSQQYLNTTGYVTTSNATPSTATSNTAKLQASALSAPDVGLTFTPSQIGVNGTSTMAITLQNPSSNGGPITGVNFTDSYPTNGSGGTMVNSSTAAFTATSLNAGCSGNITAAVGSGTLSLTNGSIPKNTTCTITVGVTSASDGSYLNNLSVNTGNAGGDTASATLYVLQPLSASVQFNPVLTVVNNTSSLIYTLYNPNNIAINSAAFTDSYPSGLANSATASATCGVGSSVCTCQSGSVTAVGAAGSLALAGATISGGATCTITVSVTSPTAGSYYNSNGGANVTVTTGNAGSSSVIPATLIVSGLPTLNVVKTANPTAGKPGDVITYTVSVTNPSTGYASNVVLTDTLDRYSYLGYGSFQFTDGNPASGLTAGQPVFDNGSGWGYPAGTNGPGGGYDGAITRWQLPMTGTMNPGSSFTVTFNIKIR